MKAPIAEACTRRSSFWQVVINRWGTISFTVVLLCLVAMGVGRLVEREWVGRVRFAIQIDHASKNDNDRWIEKELKLISDEATMLRVVRKLNLARTWKFNGDESTAMTRLSRMVETSEDRSTDIFAIEVYSPEAEEAVMLANAIAEAFEDRRKEIEIERQQEVERQELIILAKEMNDRFKNVDSKRREMLRIMEQYRIVDFNEIYGSSASGGQEENGNKMTYEMARQQAADYESEVQRLEVQINPLLSLTDQNTLLAQAVRMNSDGDAVQGASRMLNVTKSNLATLKSWGLSEENPRVKADQELIQPLSELVAVALEDFKSSLRTKVRIAKDSLARLEESIKKGGEGWMPDKTQYADYLAAKKDYEQQSSELNQMANIYVKQSFDCGMPMTPVVRVENAAKAQKVARPNTPMLLAVGSSAGLVLGIALAYFRESRKPSPLEVSGL